MQGILIATTVVLSFFIATSAWAPLAPTGQMEEAARQSGQDPAVLPPGTPPKPPIILPPGPNRAKQIESLVRTGKLPPEDCKAIQDATVKCLKAAEASGAWPNVCDPHVNQYVAGCK
jgi:hypothetical protein